jgi:hypothetical protein
MTKKYVALLSLVFSSVLSLIFNNFCKAGNKELQKPSSKVLDKSSLKASCSCSLPKLSTGSISKYKSIGGFAALTQEKKSFSQKNQDDQTSPLDSCLSKRIQDDPKRGQYEPEKPPEPKIPVGSDKKEGTKLDDFRAEMNEFDPNKEDENTADQTSKINYDYDDDIPSQIKSKMKEMGLEEYCGNVKISEIRKAILYVCCSLDDFVEGEDIILKYLQKANEEIADKSCKDAKQNEKIVIKYVEDAVEEAENIEARAR